MRLPEDSGHHRERHEEETPADDDGERARESLAQPVPARMARPDRLQHAPGTVPHVEGERYHRDDVVDGDPRYLQAGYEVMEDSSLSERRVHAVSRLMASLV